ncbi:ABC transporter substrate-binding protein [Ramlibacter solisilvae]|uniref:Solute-binding protein family 5 domain-containing protein n=1 Tax=Ramlibacter tataouinensis TaxID=94132 RepID=A0A127JUM7_9BURK|nr:ABC transporter substrate-binding protein [Ramlibacter tataouinensis]AMO23641.1 hypothetical protein UC35_13020 [Ramlibacter tataouinensis]
MRVNKSLGLFRGVLLAVAVGVSASSAYAQTLTVGSATTPSMDPHFLFLTSNVAFNRHIYSGLTQINAGNVDPDLALSWRRLSPTQWEFKLRPNVKFHDGSPFTAEDVIHSLKRMTSIPNNPNPYSGVVGSIKDARAVDETTVAIDTALPEPLLPANLSLLSIVSKKATQGAGAADFESGKAAIGTGPFKYAGYVTGSRLEVVRNDAYYGARPQWEKVVFRLITQDASRIAALLSGEVDLIEQVPPADAAKLKENAKLTVYQVPSYRIYFLFAAQGPNSTEFATDKAGKPLPDNPMRDLRVRQALSLAIDRKAIAQRVMDGAATPIGQFASPVMKSYDNLVPELPYDVERAKKLLAEAGYPNGFGLTIHCSNDRYPNDAKICQTVGQMLSRAGLAMKVETQPKTIYLPKVFPPKGGYLFGLLAWGPFDGGNATGLNGIVHTYDPARRLGTYNSSNFSNPALDARIEDLNTEFDPAKRTATEREILADVTKQLPIIPLYAGSVIVATKKGIAYSARGDEMTLAWQARPAP